MGAPTITVDPPESHEPAANRLDEKARLLARHANIPSGEVDWRMGHRKRDFESHSWGKA